jgi:outer membrane immunogenic protein
VPVEVSNWAGPYLGLQAGWGFGTVEVPGAPDIDNDGFTGGAFAGWQAQNGSFVYGLEADVNFNALDGSNGVTSTESNVDGSLRARLGYAITDRILIYATGGGAMENREITDAAGSDTNAMLGWTVGAGVDAKLTDQVFGRLEYRYADYGSETFNTGSGAQSINSQQNKVMLGIGLKF